MDKLQVLRKNLIDDDSFINVLEEWLCSCNADFTHAVTLTFAKKETDRIIAERVFGVFLHYLNERLLRRAYKSKSKQLKVAAVLEGLVSNHKHLHYHLAFELPSYITKRRALKEIQFCWDKANKTRENEYSLLFLAKKNDMHTSEVIKRGIKRTNIIDIQPFNNNGWVNYIAKEFNIKSMNCISEHCCF